LCRHHEGDMLSGMDQNEVRTVWWEPDTVCLIDQTKPRLVIETRA
jgi:hypothetical protein